MNEVDKKIFKIISEQAALLDLQAYVVGGYVRDSILGRKTKDIDIVVEGSGIALAEQVAKSTGSKVSVFKNFGTAMLRINGIEVEFVGARKESYRRDSRKPIVEEGTLFEDLERRDFTINAMAFSLSQGNFGKLIDNFGGEEDLKNGLLRTPLDPDTTFSDDPLRMIRAIRFAAQLSFDIIPELLDAIIRNKSRLSILSKERISEELHKTLSSDVPSKGFLLMDQTDILDCIMPDLAKLKGVETLEGKGHKDNFIHSLEVLDNIAKVSDNLWLRWAALLHDIGKYKTKRFDPVLGWTFHGHDFLGGKMVVQIFRTLKMPLNEKMKYVQKLVKLHLRPISLVQEEVTDSAVRRLLLDAGEDIEDLMLLCEADITSKNEKTVFKHKNNFAAVRKKMEEVEEKDNIRNFKIPITGELIMSTFNLPPCKEIGLIKEQIKNAILDGEIENDYDAAFALMIKKAYEFGLSLNKD